MGHCINAMIGNRQTIAQFGDRLGMPAPTELDFDLAIIPLSERRLDRIAVSTEEPFKGFTYLTPTLSEAMAAGIGGGRALYIETNYFGGLGGQAAALFEGGRLAWKEAETSEPSKAWSSLLSRLCGSFTRPGKSPINSGLECLGVRGTNNCDEFDGVGLGRFRSLDSFRR